MRRPSRKALKPYLLAVEIASRFTGETSSSEVTCEERSKLTEKYGVDRDLISNVLSGLRSVGVYRDKYYQQKHTSPNEQTVHSNEQAGSLGTKPNELTPSPPHSTSLETSLKPSATEVQTGLNEVPPSVTEPTVHPVNPRFILMNLRAKPLKCSVKS